ncbi:hypothetical protein GCM10010310_60610 [Streptomyces violaceolatus]|uniref:Terminase ATPase subunit N-terminal domain-containing protein n=1 Tax=Streptomyces violaceolatus TaxID=67378 RepID=A0ABN3T9C0_9ACTN
MPMAGSQNKYADFEGLRERAVALRRAGYSLRQIRDELKVFNNDILSQLVKGEPPPEWTKRPRAKDDLRAKARELRLQGWTYDQIETELGCSRSSVSMWVRDLPKHEPRYTPQRPKEQAKLAVGELSARELFPVGVGLYWAEGGKDKPYDRRENVVFVNSDPSMTRRPMRQVRRSSGPNSSAPIAAASTRRLSRATTPRRCARTQETPPADASRSKSSRAPTCTVASKALGTA